MPPSYNQKVEPFSLLYYIYLSGTICKNINLIEGEVIKMSWRNPNFSILCPLYDDILCFCTAR